MPRMKHALALFGLAVLSGPVSRGSELTQTQEATLPLTTTNFSDSKDTTPLVIQPFNTMNGTRSLDAVDLSVSAQVTNNFGMTFTTPSTITVSVASGNSSTPGPSITLYKPDGTDPLLTASAANDPSKLTRSVTYGGNGVTLPQSFGSNQPTTSAFYLAPTVSQAANALKLTAASDLALFAGSGPVSLPVSASAVSSFSSNSGNGAGKVTTQGSADVTVTYEYHNVSPAKETVPEPAAVMLWALGGAGALVAHRSRRRSASAAASDR